MKQNISKLIIKKNTDVLMSWAQRLNKHSVSVHAVGKPGGLTVQHENQSLEAHRLHSSLVYFKAEG